MVGRLALLLRRSRCSIFVVGFWAATIYKRWGTIASRSCSSASGLLLVASDVARRPPGRLGEVFAWFGAQGALGLSLWGLLLTALLAGISFLTLRRAVP